MCENCDRFGVLLFEGEIKELAIELLVESEKTQKHEIAVNVKSNYKVLYCSSCGTITIKEVSSLKEKKVVETKIAGFEARFLQRT